MTALFRNQNIFGSQQRQQGPIPKMREQRETLPGVRGYRVYQLVGSGADTRTWVVKGRLVARTLGKIQAAIANAQDLLGTFGVFIETGGAVWRNCELTDFRQSGDYRSVNIDGVGYVTVEVSGTVEQAGG